MESTAMSQAATPTENLHDDDVAEGGDEAWGDPTEEQPLLPARRRIRWLSGKSVVLLAILTGLIGFYAGIRAEKSSASGSSGATGASASGASARGFAGFAGGGGTAGTIVSVDGNTLYVKESSGNTVKVKLLSTTTLTKSSDVGSKALHP